MVHHCGVNTSFPPPGRPAWTRRSLLLAPLAALAVPSSQAAQTAQTAQTAQAAQGASAAPPVPVPVASPAAAAPLPAEAASAPVYPVRLPPPARLAYTLRSGMLRGSGQLHWAPAGDGYRLTLEGTVFGMSVLSWTSEGRLDASGLVPRRFTDKRLNRDPRIANFDHDRRRITYAGRSDERPLFEGAQDRLSWMVQLPAILLADASLQAVGRRVALYVSGARADAGVWAFEAQGREALDLPGARVPDALHLIRVSRKDGDNQADAWLDPARGLLPVRARFSDGDGGDVTDFVLSG
jgi:hypothetical protein